MSDQNAIVPYETIEKMASAVVKSGLFGMKTNEQAVTLMLLCQAEGIHPIKACQEYHIVQGRPARKADSILARFQQSGGRVEWIEYTDGAVTGVFVHPQSPTPVKIRWTIQMAQAAGLAGKDVWKQYPRQMMRSRCIGEGVRTTYPAAIAGDITVEEAQDIGSPVSTPAPRPVNVTVTRPAAPAPAPAPKPEEAPVIDAEVVPEPPVETQPEPVPENPDDQWLTVIANAQGRAELDTINSDLKKAYTQGVPVPIVRAWKDKVKAVWGKP